MNWGSYKEIDIYEYKYSIKSNKIVKFKVTQNSVITFYELIDSLIDRIFFL